MGNEAAALEYRTRMALIWKKHDVNPLKSVGGLVVQAPLFLCMFAGLRHMAAAKVRPDPALPLWVPSMRFKAHASLCLSSAKSCQAFHATQLMDREHVTAHGWCIHRCACIHSACREVKQIISTQRPHDQSQNLC